MPTRLRARAATVVVATIAVALAMTLLGGCGADDHSDASPDAADRRFLQEMIPHHERAIAVAQLGRTGADDPRVRAFAARIVREQTPELHRMRAAATGLGLDLESGARTAEHRITDAQVRELRTLVAPAYDRDFVRLHITSETGAAAMARTELRAGHDPDVLAIARPIATAPQTQIPELRDLLRSLGG